ncbi:hypothetical protein [uncultured Shewanella sp.]|uniref:hypothetical protein n=1 Tax=uncultured Shewanella sp. TaxID=173975 RepID=UPI002604E91D|nr:hypothetical protein [uncultured Shewanella sp.]
MTQENLAALSDSALAESAQNSVLLKEQALALVQTVCAENWTDHNTGDPGITLLDVLAFVISDLSYRLDFPMRELLAVDPDAAGANQEPFFLASQILPSNAVTLADHRRAVIDIPGVKNADVYPIIDDKGAGEHVTGCVNIRVDLDDDWSDKTTEEKCCLFADIRQRFIAGRNVNQDLNAIIPIEKHALAVAFSLAFENISSVVTAIADVLHRTRKVLSPGVKRYSKETLRGAGYTGDDIYDGPLLSNGFIREQDVERLDMPEVIYASDVLEALDGLRGLKRITSFFFSPLSGDTLNYGEQYLNWRFKILPEHAPRLDIALTLANMAIEIDGQAYQLTEADKQSIEDKLAEIAGLEGKTGELSHVVDEYVTGRYRELKQYISLQHEFPDMYKLAESRLDGDIDTAELANIMQFKGFLTLFDQVLADQCAQVENLRKLLALPDQDVFSRLAEIFDKMLASEPLAPIQIGQFWQDIRLLPLTQLSQPVLDISGSERLIGDYFSTYQLEGFQAFAEPVLSQLQLDRLKRSLEHLLARFAETMLDANLLKYGPVFGHYLQDFAPIPPDISTDQPLLDKLVTLKQVIELSKIINDYPILSRDRSGGFNYLSADIQQHHSAGLSHRLMSFLGFSHPGQIPLATNNRESFYLLESELLRFGAGPDDALEQGIYFIAPQWPSRLNNKEFKQLCQQQISRLSPVHLSAYFIQLPRSMMSLFERLYYAGLNALTQIPLSIGHFSGLSRSGLAASLAGIFYRHSEDYPHIDLQVVMDNIQRYEASESVFLKDAITPWLAAADRNKFDDKNLVDYQITLEKIFAENPDIYGELDAKTVIEQSAIFGQPGGQLLNGIKPWLQQNHQKMLERELGIIALIANFARLLRHFVKQPDSLQSRVLDLFEPVLSPEQLIATVEPWLKESHQGLLSGTTMEEVASSLSHLFSQHPDDYLSVDKQAVLEHIPNYASLIRNDLAAVLHPWLAEEDRAKLLSHQNKQETTTCLQAIFAANSRFYDGLDAALIVKSNYQYAKASWGELIDLIKLWLHEEDHIRLEVCELKVNLSELLESHSDAYSNVSADDILNEICHHKIQQLVNPHPISRGTIGSNFRISFEPLDYLQIPAPVRIATINPETNNPSETQYIPQLTVGVTEPNKI